MPTRVLLIDDDNEDFMIIRDSLAHLLDRYQIEWEPNYDSAFEKSVANSYDVYLLDYKLGAQSGLDFLKEARRKGCRNAILLITGYRNETLDIEAIKLGADDLLIKGEFAGSNLDRSIRYSLDRRQTQAVIADQYRQLATTVRMASLGEVAGGIAHEILNPITILLGKIGEIKESLAQGPIASKILMSSMETLENVTYRILKIIKSLRNFTNAGFNSAEKIPLKQILNDIEEMCSKKFKNLDITLKLPELDEELLSINSSPELEQVLFILVSNAKDALSQFSGERWIKIEIEIQNLNLEISVTDSGIGIPSDIREKIFLPFFSTKGPQGSGLGLSVARRLIESFQGNLLLDEDKNINRFIIRLPLEEVKANSTLPILIVDDEKDITELVARGFSDRQISTLTAFNGEEAIDYIYRQPLRAIVTDLRMPEMDGVSLIERIKNLPNLPPIFVISGFYPNAAERLKSLPIKKFYEKPFPIPRLVEDILKMS
ncbi:MAG: response regulator [Deltaproteobacteria bacterium]|nr:response regulator [Deltaproteobacteria bacterium]